MSDYSASEQMKFVCTVNIYLSGTVVKLEFPLAHTWTSQWRDILVHTESWFTDTLVSLFFFFLD